MDAVEATISYETDKNSSESLSVTMESYNVNKQNRLSGEGLFVLSPSQKQRNTLEISFYIMTYSCARLTTEGFTEEKTEDVRSYAASLSKLMETVSELHRPPKCTVKWSDERFEGFLKELKYRYTAYSDDGIPVRADFSAVFAEAEDIDGILQNDNTPASPDRTKYRTVCEGTGLFLLAYREYGDPGLWRVIAEANGIDDPLDITAGQTLVLPPL